MWEKLKICHALVSKILRSFTNIRGIQYVTSLLVQIEDLKVKEKYSLPVKFEDLPIEIGNQ